MTRKFQITALITILGTILLIALGGYVHNTQSSLACPDWPLCYGQFFPKMEGGILIEHSHRLLASLVGLLTIFLMWFGRKIPAVKVGCIILFILVCFSRIAWWDYRHLSAPHYCLHHPSWNISYFLSTSFLALSSSDF